jgi:diguanylate cyclase (GGDEF)-like protein
LAAAALLRARRKIRTLRILLGHAQYEATHDRLTGLPNRRAALTHLAGKNVGMIGLLDLDAFKDVNDLHGHHVGDQLLIVLANRLSSAIGQHGQVYRLAGDEFLLIWHRRPDNALRHAAAILAQATRPLTLDGLSLHPAASLGLALPGPHLSGTALIAAADTAMYKVKHDEHSSHGSSRVHLYPSQHPPPAAQPAQRRPPNREAQHVRPTNPGGVMQRIDTVGDLIAQLSWIDADTPIALAIRSARPSQFTLTTSELAADGTVYLAVGEQVGYLSDAARTALDW